MTCVKMKIEYLKEMESNTIECKSLQKAIGRKLTPKTLLKLASVWQMHKADILF